MTMEVLNGEDLASFVRKLPADGLSLEESMSYIEQLGAGLAYAHQADLVHSDLKPGNCFLTNEGRIKLLDFGIARASKTKGDASGELTVFDPGELGALTPAYAAIEMFDGQDPDPRDDIYALAIMSYQLLTGKHPFGRQAATKAMEQKLPVVPVDKLNKRQNRALQHGLAFLRADRTPTVEQFIDELRPHKSYFWHIFTAAVVVLALVGGGLYSPIKQYFLDQKIEQAMSTIEAAGNETEYVAAVNAVRDSFGDEPQVYEGIMEDEQVEDRLVEYFGDQANQAIASPNELANYTEAVRLLTVVEGWYPNSRAVGQRINEVNRARDQELSVLINRYNQLLAEGALIPDEHGDDIGDVLARVKQIDPTHEILNDTELPIRYADLVEAAITEDNYTAASDILRASVVYAPDDPTLSNLRYEVETKLKRQSDAIEVAEIQTRLENAVNTISSLAEFQIIRDDLIRLAALDPANQVLVVLLASLKEAFATELTKAIDSSEWDTGENLLLRFAQLLDIPFLSRNRLLLSNAEVVAGYEMSLSPERSAAVEQRLLRIKALVDDPTFSDEWETNLQVPYKELIALLPADSAALAPIRTQTAQLYLARARDSLAASRFGEAIALLDNGEQFHPGLDAFNDERNAIAAAQEALKQQQAQERLLARVKKLKSQILADARADKPQDAVLKLNEVRKELAPDDPFLSAEAPQAIANAYQRLALEQAERSNWEDAAKFAQAAITLAPDLEGLAEQLATYNTERNKRADIIELRSMLKNDTTKFNFVAVKSKLGSIKTNFPDEWRGLSNEFNKLAEARLLRIAKNNVAAAHRFREEAAIAFPPIVKVKLPPLPSDLAARGEDEVRQGLLTAARATLADAVAKDGAGHPDVARLKGSLTDKAGKAGQWYKQAQQLEQQKQVKKAIAAMKDGAMKFWTDNAEYEQYKKKLEDQVRPARKGECAPGKTGLGTRKRATCWDEFPGNTKRPVVMVVVPAGGGAPVFAIGKYEVSVAEFNTYCKLSGQCSARSGNSKLPITGISIQDAQSYTAWYSAQSGKTYRLPTEAEWAHAASAAGKQPKKNFNCRVILDGSVIKGQALRSATSGDQNGWGLVNYIGNAQEWVKSGGGVKVRGGAFEDPLSKCDISLTKSHGGGADGITGFRVVRALD